MFGFANAVFSAIVLHAIGKGLASTKYALLSTASNIAPVYMTIFDDWIHDKYDIEIMLLGGFFYVSDMMKKIRASGNRVTINIVS